MNTSESQTLDSPSLFLSLSLPSPPHSFFLLSSSSPLPPIPSHFPRRNLIPRTRFIIDAFRSAADFSVSYFLTHFHSDHYAGLAPNWCRGIIYCSKLTAQLLIATLKIDASFIVPLKLDETYLIDGCYVTAVDANHCPGAVQFLFEIKGEVNERYVHTGDFRFHELMKSDANLRRFVGADGVFLDTTYCNPKFVFPSQEESVDYVAKEITRTRKEYEENSEGSVLVLIATYVVGKEKILLEIARRCNCSLYVDSKKMEILTILGFGEDGVFTDDFSITNVHVIGWNILGETWPYFRPNFSKMKEIMVEKGYSKAVGFVCTGWMYETKKKGFAVRTKDELDIHLVPYSEHSSFDELREYVKFLKPKKVIPTVGVDSLALQKHFRGLVDETANKQEFLMAFNLKSANSEFTELGKEKVADENEDVLQDDAAGESSKDELRELLPSWVTDDQLLGLLRGSNGDIGEAVSDFYERELELYNEAKTYRPIVSVSQFTQPSMDDSKPVEKPSLGRQSSNLLQVHFERKLSQGDQAAGQGRTATSRKSVSVVANSPKRKVSAVENKTKRRGRQKLSFEPISSNQPTITKYFVKAVTSSSNEDRLTSAAIDQLKDGHSSLKVPTVMSTEEVDQFLQIINGGLSRNAAAALLEDARGNVDVAIDLYYSKSSYGSVTLEESVIPTVRIDNQDVHMSCTETVSESKNVKETLPTLFAHGVYPEDIVKNSVMLPVNEYSPVMHACWKAGDPAPYLHLARTFDLVEREKGKIKTTSMLCNMFRSLLALSPEDVLPAIYLCTNRIAADHENMELNIGGGLVVAALEEVCGTSKSKIKEMYHVYGDLGDVAQECRRTQSVLALPRPLSVRYLFCMLRKISFETGNGSTSRRKNIVASLMRSCREMEMKFLVRTLVRNLRIGAMMRTILPALGHAVVLNVHCPVVQDTESIKSELQRISTEVAEAYNVLPNLDLLVPALLGKGIAFSASDLAMSPGTPIPPMLARITNGIPQLLKLFQGQAFTCEYKYDGQRAQIHKLDDGSIRIFSRQMKESTSRFPDLINIIKTCTTAVSSFILDAEVVGVDRNNKHKILSFQELSSRDRGSKVSSIKVDNIKVDICVFIFDIMFLNGERLLACPLRERRKYLKQIFQQEKLGYLELAKEMSVEADEAFCDNQITVTKLNSFFEEACASSCEGIMVKSLDVDAGYCASKCTESWLKVKRDYIEGLGDSLDLVPIGAWYGNGRKAGWYSPFLMACYNPEAEEFQSVCRVMSGFTDAFYTEMKEFFSGEKLIPKKPPYYKTDESPTVWFSPELVWEIRGADLTISPIHHAAIGLVHPSRGISMRLPRFVRSVSDRKPEDCSTAAEIAQMFNSQTRKMEVKTETD